MLTGKLEPPEKGTRGYDLQSRRVDCVQKMRELFKEVVIRRKNMSLDNEGNVIHGLPKLDKFYIYLDMSEEERATFADISRKTQESL